MGACARIPVEVAMCYGIVGWADLWEGLRGLGKDRWARVGDVA